MNACRVGRTGRAGDKEGVAWSLLEAGKDGRFAGLLVQSLGLAGQEVPLELHELAMKVGRAATVHLLCTCCTIWRSCLAAGSLCACCADIPMLRACCLPAWQAQ